MIAASLKNSKNSWFAQQKKSSNPAPDYEVLIIGAGISGIGMACRLQQGNDKYFEGKHGIKNAFRASNKNASKRFLILEKRADLGGTWDLFTYPGIRSDSDALTFGYDFRPWLNHTMLATGADIKRYIADTAREFNIVEHIRYQHEVQQLSWSSDDKQWSASVKNHANGEVFTITANFVVGATGYYDYAAGYRPQFKEEARFQGDIVHPQQWGGINYHDKKVVVIGSGATAMTLVPALVDKTNGQCARQVTMLQRSPTYVASLASNDRLLDWLSSRYSPMTQQQVYSLLRARNVLFQQVIYQAATHSPKLIKTLLKHGVQKALKGSDVDSAHFTPAYNPWDERLCAVPDGDLFVALKDTRAEIITDNISHFTETGIALQSGKHIDADIIVTATGLQLQMLGGATLVVDGEPVDVGTRMTYKAVLLEGVPNLAIMFGYTNASWTLKIDLACQYVMRLLHYMNKHGHKVAVAQTTTAHKTVNMQPDTVLGALSAGYVRRAKELLPKQGDRYPWHVTNNYLSDLVMLKYRNIKDHWLQFTS